MRLSVPFVRLPLLVDAAVLAAEVDALDASSWRDHPENAPGNTAVPLVAVDGDPTNDERRGAMLPTPYLDALPYTRSILHALGGVIGRSRLMRIQEEGELTPHVDVNYYWRDHLRVHVPCAHHARGAFRMRRRRCAHGGRRGVGVRHVAPSSRHEPGARSPHPPRRRHRRERLALGSRRAS